MDRGLKMEGVSHERLQPERMGTHTPRLHRFSHGAFAARWDLRLLPTAAAGRPGIHVSGDGRQNSVSRRHRAGSGTAGDCPVGKENSETAEPGLLAQLLETRRIGDFCYAS